MGYFEISNTIKGIVDITVITDYPQCEHWMRDGAQLLIDTGRQAQQCKSPAQAEQLIKNLERFVEQGKTDQEARLQRISELAAQLYGRLDKNQILTMTLSRTYSMRNGVVNLGANLIPIVVPLHCYWA